MIGQDPFVITNKFLTERKWPLSKQGLLMKGLTVFLPLSPSVTLCMYDGSTYRFNGNRMGFQLKNEEIDNLNLFQFFNTENSIYYFQQTKMLEYLKQMSDSFRTSISARILETPVLEGKQIVITGTNDYPVPPKQSFLLTKVSVWKLPLTYVALERSAAKSAVDFLKRDPKFEMVFPKNCTDA